MKKPSSAELRRRSIEHRRKYYGSCSLSELVRYKRRLDAEINERRRERRKKKARS